MRGTERPSVRCEKAAYAGAEVRPGASREEMPARVHSVIRAAASVSGMSETREWNRVFYASRARTGAGGFVLHILYRRETP